MKLIFKSTIIKIKKSYGRFLSVLFIVALGMGFFAGLRETSPAMIDTVEYYYDTHELMDIKIISSLGLTTNDILSLKDLNNIEKVIPSYSVDTLINGKSIRIHALEDEINLVKLVKGRMPKNNNECLGDNTFFKLNQKYNFIGDSVLEYLNINNCQVVGLINSPLYVSTEKGISKVGNGKLEGFIFTNKDNFNYDVYTEVYLTAKNTKEVYANSNEYKKYYDLLYEELITLKPIREAIRYEELLSEAMDEINKIQNEVNEEIKDAENKLKKSKTELDTNQKKLNDGKKELDVNEKNLLKTQSSKQKQIDDGKLEINNNLNILENTIKNLGFNWGTLNSKIKELKNNISYLKQELTTLDPNSQEYITINENIKILEENLNNLLTLQTNKKTLDNELKNLLEMEEKLNEEINNGLKTIETEKIKLENNQIKLNDGYKKYNDGINKLNKEKIKAKDKITEAKEELKTIKEPIWYLLSREDNNGYRGFYNDAETIGAIAKVFPMFFIVIVALITLNTISRMIEEERTEIGIYKALGYKNKSIMFGYIFYIMLATAIGASVGLFAGYNAIPRIIYGIFRVSYIVPNLVIYIKLVPFFIMIGVAIILLMGVTIWGCYQELRVVSAELLRPKSPKIGKNIFLEKINFFWKRLSFTWKITIRNIFRYKSRIIMTVLGVAGSSALLVAGFGIRDSITDLSDLQFKNVIKYDVSIYLNKNINNISTELKSLLDDNNVINPLLIKQESYSFKNIDGKSNNVSLIVPEQENRLNNYISLESIYNNEQLAIPNHGVLITQRMAELMDVKIDDNIKIRNNNNRLFIVQVKGIVKNYTLNYIYMSNNYYNLIFENGAPQYNSVLAHLSKYDYENISTNLINSDEITAVNYTKDNVKYFEDLVSNLNKIFYMIISSAAALAFIILYNLTSINVNERIKEIATLKVLGFNDNEVTTYVYRETYVLSIAGIIWGLFLGIGLHQFIVVSAEPDNLVFIRNVKFLSFIYSVIAILLFLYIVKIFTHFKLKKIDMIGSLKSTE